jgi:hypothetical protein
VDGQLHLFAVPVPPAINADAEIARLRTQGYGWRSVAASLNRRGVPTPSGRGQWHCNTAYRHVNRDVWAAYMRRYRRAHAGR